MKKNLCKTLVMMLVMSSITLTVKATDLSDLFEVGKIYTIPEVGEIIRPYDNIQANFLDATSVTTFFCWISNKDGQGTLWWTNWGNNSYTTTSDAKFLCASFSGNIDSRDGYVYFTAYEEYTPTLDITGVGTLTVTPQPCGIGQTATITASSGIIGSIALMIGENGTDGTIEIGKTYTYQQIVDFATSNNFHKFFAKFDSDKLSYFKNETKEIIDENGLTVDEAKTKKWYAVSVENNEEENEFSCSFICADIPLTTVTEGEEYTFTMPCVNPTIKATFLNFDSKAEYVIVTYNEGGITKKAYYKTFDVKKIEWKKGSDL